jgi:hypothetical protein
VAQLLDGVGSDAVQLRDIGSAEFGELLQSIPAASSARRAGAANLGRSLSGRVDLLIEAS